MFEGTLAQIALGIQSGCSKHEARNQQPSSQTRTGCKARGFSGRQTSPTSPKPESAIALSPKSSFMLLHITFSPKRFKRPYSAFSFATWLTSGFGGSFGSLAPYLIGILIIPGSLAPPISMPLLVPATHLPTSAGTPPSHFSHAPGMEQWLHLMPAPKSPKGTKYLMTRYLVLGCLQCR